MGRIEREGVAERLGFDMGGLMSDEVVEGSFEYHIWMRWRRGCCFGLLFLIGREGL